MRKKRYISEGEAYQMFLALVEEKTKEFEEHGGEDKWDLIHHIYWGLWLGELDERYVAKGYDILHRYE